MSFFEPPPPLPEPSPQPPYRPWHGPPAAVVGRTVALDLMIGRSEKAAVWIPALTVYDDGFEFGVEIRHRLDDDAFLHPFFMHHHLRRPSSSAEGTDELPPELLLLGMEFADGRKATNLGSPVPWPTQEDPEAMPEGPSLQPSGGGGGGGGRWRHGYYGWPLPPDGPLAFVCEWPAANIAQTRTEIDGGLLCSAAPGTVVLWDDDKAGGSRGSAYGTFQQVHAVAHPAPAPAEGTPESS
jgi:hypothetical protein